MDVRERGAWQRPAALLAGTLFVGALVWLAAGPVGLAVVVALGLATSTALSHVRRTRPAEDPAEVEAAVGAPLLAHLVEPEDPTLLPTLDAGSAAAAAYDHVRFVVERRAVGPTVLSGLGPGGAHVWVGANLAIALATAGRRVLLVDSRPGGADAGAPGALGLHDVLRGADLEAALVAGPVAGLQVLGPGRAEPGGAALGDAFTELAQRALSRFDHVLVLAPPLAESDRALTVAAGAGLVLTVPQGAVRLAALRDHAGRLRDAETRLLGVVLVTPTAQAPT